MAKSFAAKYCSIHGRFHQAVHVVVCTETSGEHRFKIYSAIFCLCVLERVTNLPSDLLQLSLPLTRCTFKACIGNNPRRIIKKVLKYLLNAAHIVWFDLLTGESLNVNSAMSLLQDRMHALTAIINYHLENQKKLQL